MLDGYQRGHASMVYKLFDKKSASLTDKSVSGSGIVNNNNNNNNNNSNNNIKQNLQLTKKELHKPIIRKFKKRNVYSRFRDNIWGADLADMHLISKCNKGFRFLLCVIDIFSKYVWQGRIVGASMGAVDPPPLSKKVPFLKKNIK